jgi:hypothetical protein
LFDETYIGHQELNPTGLWVNNSVGKAFIVGSTNDRVYEYSIITKGLLIDSEKTSITGSVEINKDVYIGKQLRVVDKFITNGKVGIGNVGNIENPIARLQVVSETDNEGIQIRRNSVTANVSVALGFRFSQLETASVNNNAEIRAVLTSRQSDDFSGRIDNTDLSFRTGTGGSPGERMRIRDDGQIYIGSVTQEVLDSQFHKLTVNGGINVIGEVLSDGASIHLISSNHTIGTNLKGKLLRVTSASTITIPTNTTSAIPINREFYIVRYGTGVVSIAPASGVTLNSALGHRKIKDQYGYVTLKKISTNEWLLYGSLEA